VHKACDAALRDALAQLLQQPAAQQGRQVVLAGAVRNHNPGTWNALLHDLTIMQTNYDVRGMAATSRPPTLHHAAEGKLALIPCPRSRDIAVSSGPMQMQGASSSVRMSRQACVPHGAALCVRPASQWRSQP
jgi:hypothetical protein